jgi:hypothetical protein
MDWKQVAPGTYAEDLTEEERVEAYTLTEDDIRTVVGLSEDIEVEIE